MTISPSTDTDPAKSLPTPGGATVEIRPTTLPAWGGDSFTDVPALVWRCRGCQAQEAPREISEAGTVLAQATAHADECPIPLPGV